MLKKIKNYFEYRRNLKKVKKELVKMAAAALPLLNKTVSSAAKAVENFRKNSVRIVEIMDYIAEMEPEELHSLIEHARMETLKDNDE